MHGIYENINILQDQNKLQQDQTLELAHFLNLTVVLVGEHQETLYDLDTRLIILDRTLMSTMQALSYLRCIPLQN